MALEARGPVSRLGAGLRAGVRVAQDAARELGSFATELRARRLFARSTLGPGSLLCVYRERNQDGVRALVEAARELGHSVALWALDEKVPSLAAFTVGVGAGLRMDLLNRLWDVARADAPAQVVVADDDVSFARGSLAQLLGAASVCGFGIAQPARRRDGDFSHEITRERALTLARQTTFVEIGPLFVVSGAWIPKVLPFPEGFGMGWGLELLWQELHRDGCGLGVVDCVSVDHPGRAGSREYDAGPEGERLRSMLQERKLESTAEGQRTLRSWHVWQARPPWSALDAPADLEGAR